MGNRSDTLQQEKKAWLDLRKSKWQDLDYGWNVILEYIYIK